MRPRLAPISIRTTYGIGVKPGTEISYAFCVCLSWPFVAALGVVFALVIAARLMPRLGLKAYEIEQAEFGFGGQKVTIRPNIADIEIAYKTWIELNTRKIGLPIGLSQDVILE